MMAKQVEHDHFADEPASDTAGNLFGPDPRQARETGGWRRSDGEPVDVEQRFERQAGPGA